MAEEITSQESELQSELNNPSRFERLNSIAADRISEIEASLNLPARPTAIDSYKDIAGNPITGSNPASKHSDSYNSITNRFNTLAADKSLEDSTWGAMRPFTYNGDFDGAKFERYHSSGDVYNKLGFSPYRDNESLYNDKMTFGDQFVRAAKQWDDMVGVGFMSGVRSWKTIFTDPLAPDIEGARDMQRIMTNGGSQSGGIGGFFINTFLNSGYTIGIGLNYLAEEVVLMGATAATGGILGATTVPTMVGRGLNAVNKMFEGTKAVFTGSKEMQGIKAIGETVPEMRTWWSTVGQGAKNVVKETANILNPLDQTLAAVRATDYATDYAKVAKTFGAFADDMLMMKNAVSEAKLEAGMVKLDLTNSLIEEYRAKNNGANPDQKAMEDIEKLVDKEAFNTALWNLPAINTTNKLMYATMLAPLNKIMGRQGAVELIDDYVFNNKTFSALGEGILAKGTAALKSFKNPKFYGQFGMNYLKANIAEGVQENIQEIISKAASEHAIALYKDPIRASYEGYMPHVLKNFNDQFSAQGAETFAGGLAMGLFAQPVMGATSLSMSKLLKAFGTEDYAKAEQLQKEVKARNVEHLNNLYNNVLTYLAPDLPNAVKTGRLADDLYTAARNGNKKEAIDALENIKNNYILTAAKLGKLDIMIDKMKEYKNLTRQEAVEAFSKYGIKEEDVDKAIGKIDDVVARAERFKTEYADVAEKYPNPFDSSKFALNTPEHTASVIAKEAWDTATYNLMFAKATYDTHSKRVAEVAQIFSGLSNDLAKSDAQNLMTLLDPNSVKGELVMLKKEISVLDESLPEQKQLKAEKTKQLEKLTTFYKAVEAIKAAKNETESTVADKNAKDAFLDYVKFLAKKNDNIVFNDEINKAYGVVKDHMALKNEMKNLARSINVLMTPQNFFNFHTRLNETLTTLYNTKEETIEENQNLIEKIKNIQGFTNAVTSESGLYVPNELIGAYHEALESGGPMPVPTHFVDPSGNLITEGPKFDIAMDLWNKFVGVTVKPKVEKPEVKAEKLEAELPKTEEEAIEAKAKQLLQQPRQSLTPAEEKSLRFGLPGSSTLETRKQFIENRIKLLEKKKDALGLDASEISDTLKYLNEILETSTESAHNTVDNLQKQINTLLSTIKSKSAKKTARGVKAIERITELKVSYRSEFQLLNDITDRIKELQEELTDLENIQKDLEKQAQYYNSLLADSTLSTFSREELTARRDKINGKINTISRLLEVIGKAITDSIRYIREHVSALLQTDKKLKTFISENEYENFQYPNIKNKIESLQNEALNNMESIEFLEEAKASEETRQAQLLDALLNYQDQVRYLEELIYNYNEGEIKDKFKDMTLNTKEIVDENQSKYPVTISRKNARIERRIKEAKALNNELQQADSVVVTPTDTTTPIESTVSEFSLEDISPQKLNEDISLKTLKLAQSLGYEVTYNNNDYKIANIGSNSVTLKTALGTKVVVNENKIKSSLRIVKPGIKEATKEENETIKSNEKIVSENPKEFTEEKVAKLTIEEYKTLFKKSICS